MNLNDTRMKSLDDILKECKLTDLKYHTNDKGEVCTIEVKYQPVSNESQVSDRNAEGWKL